MGTSSSFPTTVVAAFFGAVLTAFAVVACGSLLGLSSDDDNALPPQLVDATPDGACNGNIDCAGATCSAPGFACAPTAPGPDWIGPLLIHTIDGGELAADAGGGADAADCPTQAPTLVLKAGSGELSDVGKNQCTCDCTSVPEQCVGVNPPTLEGYANVGCGSACNSGATVLTANKCTSLSTLFDGLDCLNGHAAVVVNSGVTANGKCEPKSTLPTATFKTLVHACAPQTTLVKGGCPSAADVCGPFGGTLSNGRVCIVHAPNGDVECVGPYLDKSIYFKHLDDSRKCPDCQCNAFAGTCVGTIYKDSMCSTPNTPIPVQATAPNNCFELLDKSPMASTSFKWNDTPTVSPGSCTPIAANDRTVIGTIAPNEPVTVCCLPK